MKQWKQLADHLDYFLELGITGVSRDFSWRSRGVVKNNSIECSVENSSVINREGSLPKHSKATGKSAIGLEKADLVNVLDVSNSEKSLKLIREELGDCTRCKLHSSRKTLVFGVGNPNARLMFVGEAPGRDEDLQGIPFVGRAGKLLTKIIESIDLKRDDVYIANVIKCRPPDNRNPDPEEIETCEPFLFSQIDAIKPLVIVALGTFASRTLLRSEEVISKLRGQVYDYRGSKLIPTFHPAFLLRSPTRKRDVWEDMKKARSILREG